MAMKVSTFNGVKVYNLSSGKSVAGFMSDAKKRKLAKDEDYSRRIELIQDFEMATASQCITMSNDGEYILLTGGYPPMVRCFTTSDLAMKFQRGLTCDVVGLEMLSDDYSKFVLLQSDRTLDFHAAYGHHYSLRVPKFGRDMAYCKENCDLFVACSGEEIYRFNLESGQFKEPFTNGFVGCNKIRLNPQHRLLAAGGEGGMLQFWDTRSRKSVANQIIKTDASIADGTTCDITALTWDKDGLTMGVGTSDGNVFLYDIRSSKPLYNKEHQYGLPIIDVTFHNGGGDSAGSVPMVISTDKKLTKIWHRNGPTQGQILTNVEATADINAMQVVSDKRGQSGLLMLAGEQQRVMTYFIPQLGPAPRWCSFLEGLTEELEESSKTTVYEDFKFVTKLEVEELGATSLIGTNILRAYMHGYFMEMKTYKSLRAVAKPFEYDEYRKKKMAEKLEAKRGTRISMEKRLPKVNKLLAEKMMKIQSKTTTEEGGESAPKSSNIVDDRFASLFTRDEFEQDPDTEEFRLRNPTSSRHDINRRNAIARGGDSEDELDVYQEVEMSDGDDSDDDSGGNQRYSNGYDDNDSGEASDNDKHDEEEEDELAIRNPDAEPVKSKKRKSEKKENKDSKKAYQNKDKGNKVNFYELADNVSSTSGPISMYAQDAKEKRKAAKSIQSKPLSQRLDESSSSSVGTAKKTKGITTHFSFMPKATSDKKKGLRGKE